MIKLMIFIKYFSKIFLVVDITPDEGILVLKLPEQPHIIKMKNLNPGDVNSELIWYWQLGEMTIKKYAL